MVIPLRSAFVGALLASASVAVPAPAPAAPKVEDRDVDTRYPYLGPTVVIGKLGWFHGGFEAHND